MSYTSLLTQTVTYWAPISNDGYGDLTYEAPTQLLARWQDTVDTFQDTAGEEFISDATVYTTTELEENGWLYLGTSAESNPQDQDKAFRIRRRNMSQTPNGSIVVYKNICG